MVSLVETGEGIAGMVEGHVWVQPDTVSMNVRVRVSRRVAVPDFIRSFRYNTY
jgi:hypothetical protein